MGWVAGNLYLIYPSPEGLLKSIIDNVCPAGGSQEVKVKGPLRKASEVKQSISGGSVTGGEVRGGSGVLDVCYVMSTPSPSSPPSPPSVPSRS